MELKFIIGVVFLFGLAASSVVRRKDPDVELAYKLLVEEHLNNGRIMIDNSMDLRIECDLTCPNNGKNRIHLIQLFII
jgi:hypothetical protein